MKRNNTNLSRWTKLKSELNNLQPKSFRLKLRATKEPVIIDVRTPDEFAEGGIPNAINISYLADDFWDQIERLNNGGNIFVYCRTGRRSIRACTLMRNGGFNKDRIFNLEGGYQRWKRGR